MYTIIFKTEDGVDKKVDAQLGDNLLELAQDAGVAIDAPCAGAGTCGKCRARLIAGTVETTRNIRLSDEDYDDGWRLVCQSAVCGDATLMVPASGGSFRRGIKTADLSSAADLQVHQNTMDAIFGMGIQYGREQQGLGIAVDIGTTTVAAVLVDIQSRHILGKASMGNGQIRYGADVINRIINQSKPGGVEKLQRAVREETLVPIIEELCSQAGVEPGDVRRATIAGNTTMEHLLVGANAESIRLEPFVPEFLELHDQTADMLGLPLAPDAPVTFAPNVGSYVGGDISAGVLSSLMWHADEMTLFVDLGTNGELVFGNSEFMLCCACSAGPAFEGGDISCGMRASTGAIDSCTIDPQTMDITYTTIGDSAPAGLCGSGLIDIVAELFKTGIINARGKFVRDGDRIIRTETGAEYVLTYPQESATNSLITINETDLDNFIRAKGAIFSAIRTMLQSLDMPMEVMEHVIIAGGIGNGINIANAISIGMLPNLPLECYSYIGNSSLSGAAAMLLSQQAEDLVFDLGRNMTYIELSTYPGYMDEFVASCFIPHTDASLFE